MQDKSFEGLCQDKNNHLYFRQNKNYNMHIHTKLSCKLSEMQESLNYSFFL